MNRKFSRVKSTVMAAALMAVVSGLAHADGLSESQLQALSSEGPAWHPEQWVINNAPSTFRVSNPYGLSERQLQAVSTEAPHFALAAPVFDSARSEFAMSRPHGLSEREMQALSSEGAHWQLPTQTTTSSVASTNEAAFSINAAK